MGGGIALDSSSWFFIMNLFSLTLKLTQSVHSTSVFNIGSFLNIFNCVIIVFDVLRRLTTHFTWIFNIINFDKFESVRTNDSFWKKNNIFQYLSGLNNLIRSFRRKN